MSIIILLVLGRHSSNDLQVWTVYQQMLTNYYEALRPSGRRHTVTARRFIALERRAVRSPPLDFCID